MKGGVVFLLALICSLGFSQQVNKEKSINSLYIEVDTLPQYPGGVEKFYEYLGSQKWKVYDTIYPICSKIYIQFTVKIDGKIENVKCLKGINEEINNQAIKLISNMPNWTPARVGGEKVNYTYTLPIGLEFK